MKIELHILQNFAPSNLNRDDTGAPKDCELGGYRRGRVSSQCLKRAVRSAFVVQGDFLPDELAVRTKRLVDNAAAFLESKYDREREEAARVVACALPGAGLQVTADLKTQYLLFLPRLHVEALADIVQEYWDELLPSATEAADPQESADSGKSSSKRKAKNQKKDALPKELTKRLAQLFEDSGKTPDLALFGRMIADEPKWNVEAACQVAHAISTNRFVMDFDFYTAVDDLRPGDTAGSDMMGTVQFSSSCFYRYSVLDLDALRRNLAAGEELLRRTTGAWIRASSFAIPTGKQNSMAAHSLPSYVLAIVREKGVPVSLVNAFAQPVRPSAGKDLITASIEALEAYLQAVSTTYGSDGVRAFYVADRHLDPGSDPIRLVDGKTLDGLIQSVEATALGAAHSGAKA